MLHGQGIEVTLYPMLFIDALGKPWRGEITASDDKDVESFFKEYNKFILHYASLEYNGVKLRDAIEGFIIGTEMEGLTKYHDGKGRFIAVDGLINLAARVRAVVGTRVKISYAANWTEYACADGWHHLDALWADVNIDYVGINAYFPLAMNALGQDNNTESTVEDGGQPNHKQQAAPGMAYRESLIICPQVKGIADWWASPHINPDRTWTAWRPKMKPITFTEIGFTAIDHTVDAPYKYLDRSSPDKGLPPNSRGLIDPKFQHEAIAATIASIQKLLASPGNEGLLGDVFWYNVDPKGRSADWIHNHELKVAEFEKGQFSSPVFGSGKARYPMKVEDFLAHNK